MRTLRAHVRTWSMYPPRHKGRVVCSVVNSLHITCSRCGNIEVDGDVEVMR